MSWQGWTAIVIWVIAVLILVGSALYLFFGSERELGLGGLGVGAFVAFVGAVIIFFGSWTVVGTRQIAIVTMFGRPTGATYDNGWHWKNPFANTAEMDGAVQIDWHKNENPNADPNDPNTNVHGGAIQVRLGNGSNAWADTSVRWEIKQDAAAELYVQYKTFDNVRTNLITRNLQVALNEVFAHFDPLARQNLTTSPLPQIAIDATHIMQAKVGDQVAILEVQVPTIDYDRGTEDKINAINQQIADTAKAKEAENTAKAQAAANDALSKSISNDPNVLVSKCFDTAREIKQPMNCWPWAGVPTPVLPVPTR